MTCLYLKYVSGKKKKKAESPNRVFKNSWIEGVGCNVQVDWLNDSLKAELFH